MSNYEPEQPPGTDEVDPNSPQGLREAAKRGREAAKENSTLKRENALLRSGIDTTTPMGTFFAEHYQGDLEPDAIRAAAAELGLGGEAEKPPPPDTSQDDAAASQARKGLAAESIEHEAPTEEDPYEAGWTAFQDDLKAGRNRSDASAAWFDKIVGAAARGDDRVLIDPNSQVPSA